MKRTPLARRTKLRPASPTHAKLWELARKAVLLRDGHRCQCPCGRTKDDGVVLQVHHIIPRSKAPRLRYRLENLITLTKGDHLLKAHSVDAREAAAFMEALIPPERLAMLDMMRETRGRAKRFDAVTTELYLRQELAKLTTKGVTDDREPVGRLEGRGPDREQAIAGDPARGSGAIGGRKASSPGTARRLRGERLDAVRPAATSDEDAPLNGEKP